jgi:hypothetical protein
MRQIDEDRRYAREQEEAQYEQYCGQQEEARQEEDEGVALQPATAQACKPEEPASTH